MPVDRLNVVVVACTARISCRQPGAYGLLMNDRTLSRRSTDDLSKRLAALKPPSAQSANDDFQNAVWGQ
jgi:hypothetical protein